MVRWEDSIEMSLKEMVVEDVTSFFSSGWGDQWIEILSLFWTPSLNLLHGDGWF